MLVDLHCDLNVLVTEAVLHIFGRSTLFGKHGGVGVTKTVVIKLVKPKLCAGDMTDMLHIAAVDIDAAGTDHHKMDFPSAPLRV